MEKLCKLDPTDCVMFEIAKSGSSARSLGLKIGLGVGIPAHLILIGFVLVYFRLRRAGGRHAVGDAAVTPDAQVAQAGEVRELG